MTDNRPLSGIRVLDLTQVYAGPTCTRILADLGAEVIKLEGLQRMDITRNFAVNGNDSKGDYWNRGGYFPFRNSGKKSLTLDWSDEQAFELLKRLVPLCDIVAESFTPHVMTGKGLGYEDLKAIREDIIMISLSGYGQDGPWKDYSAYGMGLEPASGISSVTGYRGQGPLRSGISFTDPYSGMVGAGAVLAALHYRHRTGQGQYIDLSEHEAAVPVVGYALMEQAMNGRLPERLGDRSYWYAPQGAYQCNHDDDWLVITVRNDTEWAAFCEATGHPEWAQDSRFGDVLARFENHDALDDAITSWTRTQDQHKAMHLLQKAGVIAAAVLSPKQVLLDPHLKARGFFDIIEQPDVGKKPVPKQLGAKFSAFSIDCETPAPRLGEHNREVLQGLLGLSDDEIAALEERKVIGDTPILGVPLDVMRMFVQWPLATYQQMGALGGLETDYKEQLGLE
jgi:crotonobetainyl-CoA:carnitine CoA-transferase CaiB-like acyl-CoA transferase